MGALIAHLEKNDQPRTGRFGFENGSAAATAGKTAARVQLASSKRPFHCRMRRRLRRGDALSLAAAEN